MVDAELITYIVSTYELPGRTSERLTRIAIRRMEQNDIESFEYQYGYIAALVDRYTRRRGPSRVVSLDAPASSNDRRTLYCFVGRCDDEDRASAQPEWMEQGLSRAIELVGDRLSRPQLAFLNNLADYAGDGVAINPHRAADEVELIRDRMDELSARYQRCGQITLPRRPIKEVRFDPFMIRFAHRRLKGRALDFFRAHAAIYGGLTRSELARFDPGLYQALQAEGTMNTAIP